MKLTEAWTAAIDDYVIDLAWSPVDPTLAVAAGNGPISLFQKGGGALQRKLTPDSEGTNAIAWQPDGKTLAAAGQDGCIRFWSASDFAESKGEISRDWVDHLSWRPTPNSSGTFVVAAASGKKMAILSETGNVLHQFAPAPKTISAVAWHPQGACLAAAHFGGVRLWDGDDFHSQKELAYNNAIHALIWSGDGRWLVSGNQDPSVHLWVPEEDNELHMSGYESKVKDLSFDKTGRWLATGGSSEVCIWDCAGAGPEGRIPLMLSEHKGRISSIAFQRTHGLLASAATDGSVAIWNTTRRQPLVDSIKLNGTPTKLVWSPDDSALAVGTDQGAVLVFNMNA